MRSALGALALLGCAEGTQPTDTTDPTHNFAPEPPPGAMTETRYTLDCTTLDLPDDIGPFVQDGMPVSARPSGTTVGTVPGFKLDPEAIPLGMVVYTRLSDELLDWVDRHGLPLEQGVERWRSDVSFDAHGRALVECHALAACRDDFPCKGWADDSKPNWPVLFGWMQDPIELIVWE